MNYLLAGALLGAVSAPVAADTLVVGNKVEHSVSFIDLPTGKEVARRPTGRAPHEIAVSPDGRLAVVVSYREQGFEGSTLHLFDIGSARQTGTITLEGHRGLHGLKWIPGTNRIIVTSEVTNNVAIVDVKAGKTLHSIATGQKVSHMVAVTPDRRRAFVANIGSGSVTAIDLVKASKIRDVAAGAGAEAISVSPDGRQLWVGTNEDRKVVIFDTATLARIGEFAVDGVPIRVEFTPNGRSVAISLADKDKVLVVDSRTRKPVASVDMSPHKIGTPVTMLFDPLGARLWVAATASEAVAEIDTRGWTVRRILRAGKGSDGLGYSRQAVRLTN